MKLRQLLEADHTDIHEELKADSRGRITLGSEYADERVSVVVVDRADPDQGDGD